MPQGVLAYQYEVEKREAGLTALAGLPVYLDLARVLGLSESVQKYVRVREGTQGYTDGQMITALMLLNLAGGDCVDDLRVLEADDGFCRVLRRVELQGMKRQERRALERRWRKERRRAVPSPSAAFRYLSAFHDEAQESGRQAGKAFIPCPNEPLRGLAQVNRDLVAWVQSRSPSATATLDLDATLVSTGKQEALYGYKGFKAYQPLNVYWAEQEMLLYTEFRDGNVPAGFEILRVLQEALELLPAGVEQVRLRSDTAAYQHELLRYCELKDENRRFNRLEFAVGCDVTPAFKQAVVEVEESAWRKLPGDSEREWAEVCFVPNAVGHSKKGPGYRYLATREALRQDDLPGLQRELPFPTVTWNTKRYKVFGLVTNMSWAGAELIPWFYQRCGKSEAAHSVMKADLAGGKLPSGDFGVNAAWWWIMILALNLNAAMKRLVLKGSWVSKRLKAVRFALINLAGRVLERSRSLIIRLSAGHPAFSVLLEARRRIAELAAEPSG
jgi:hypothetical protein